MLSSNLSRYLPYAGILMLILAIVFESISAIDYKNLDKSKSTTDALSFNKYHNLALIFSICGVALMVAPN